MHPSLSYPPHLVGLTITNDPPPAAAIQEVKDLLTKSNQELLEAHAEILRLKEKAECLQQLIDSYRSILSPFRNLPQDTLREIFYHCLPTHRNSTMSARDVPMVLTRVCSLWRSVALTTPHIWTKIHIPIPGHPASSWIYPSYLPESALAKRRQIFSKLMQLRCQVAKEWLDRSGTCPLSISISYPTEYVLSRFRSLERDGVDDELTDPLIEILLAFASRWSDIHFWMPPSLYQKLESRLSNVLLPTLQNFTAKVYSRIGQPGTANIIQAPNLQKLSLTGSLLTFNNPTILPSITNQLTHLAFYSPISDHDFFNIIKVCRSLIRCQVELQAPWPQFHMFPSQLLEPNMEEVDLPNLEVLKLYDMGGPSFIFRRIKTPFLKELQYKSKLRYNGQDHNYSSLLQAEPLFAILQNTGAPFRKLTIETSTLRRDDTPIWVHMADTVSHLVTKDSHSINKGYMEEDILINDLEDFDLNLLRVVNNPTPTPETPHTKIPLPNLDTLEVYGAQKFTDEEILGVLKSRIDASRRGEVSPLRKVKFQFWRQKQIDFRAEVVQYAESAGIAMELELEYPPDALMPYIGRLSPSLLLPGPSLFDLID